LPFGERADDLLSRLAAGERIAMLHQRSPAVPRLGVAEFSTGCEGIHGAAWDPDLARQVGLATGREVRALHDDHPLISLNVWVPAVNLRALRGCGSGSRRWSQTQARDPPALQCDQRDERRIARLHEFTPTAAGYSAAQRRRRGLGASSC
jgi:hypothetical protein